MDTAVDTSRLLVERFRAAYTVSKTHPAPLRVRQKLDEAVEKRLPDVLRAALSPWFSRHANEVWLIRRLNINLEVNAAWKPDRLAKAYALAITRSLAQILQSDGDAGVIHFPNRPAYLAHFLVDLAAGHAWGKWYYERFRGLHMLPVSAAVRTAVCEEPAEGLAALLHLSEKPRARVLQTLSTQDARRVLERLSAGSAAGSVAQTVEAVWQAWNAIPLPALHPGREPVEVLRLYLQVCGRQRERAGPVLRAATRAFVRLARRLAQAPAAQGERLLTALAASDPSTLFLVAGAADAGALGSLREIPSRRMLDIGRTLLAQYTGSVDYAVEAGAGGLRGIRSKDDAGVFDERTPSARSLPGEKAIFQDSVQEASICRATPFGGLFLLLPLLDALPVDALTHHWPRAGDTPPAAVFRLLLLVKCLGRPRAYRALIDPVLRDLLGIDAGLTKADLARWQARLSRRKHLDAMLEGLAAWQAERDVVRGETLALMPVSLPGAPAGVVVDLERGVWLYAAGYRPARPHRLVERVRAWLAEGGYQPAVFVSPGLFAESLRAAFPEAAVHAPESPFVAEMAAQDSVRKGLLARLPQTAEGFDYLALPRSFHPSRPADLALSVAAQGVLRAFAWRLPGFAASSLPYLFNNFLDVSGALEEESARRVVRLGRPPLQFVLGLTGMARQHYRLRWLDARPFVLFQEGE